MSWIYILNILVHVHALNVYIRTITENFHVILFGIFRKLLKVAQPAMGISGGQGANGPQLFELAPIFLEMGVTVALIFWSQKASKCGFPAKYNKTFARASGARTYHPLKF